MNINRQNMVDPELIKAYSEIDGLKVIEDLLLFKGCDIVPRNGLIIQKYLDDMALITYSLKVNPTNRLYVGWHLDKFYKRNGMVEDGKIKCPVDIYKKVEELHKRFKTEGNKNLE